MDTESTGIDTRVVGEAESDLHTCYGAMATWHDNMWALKSQVVADWYGGGSEQFESSYNTLSEKMKSIVQVCQQYEQFAADEIEGWTGVDACDESAMLF